MTDAERKRLPKPERTAPLRRFAAAPARVAASSEANTGAGGAAGMGYQVVEEYLREGQRVAASLSAPLSLAGATGLQALSERLLRDGLLWLEAIARLSASGAAHSNGGDAASAISVSIDSRRPTHMAVRLHPGAAARPLAAHPLHAPGRGAQLALGVEFARDARGGYAVAIHVADDVPPGSYAGIVYDRDDGAVRGTIELRVEPAAPA